MTPSQFLISLARLGNILAQTIKMPMGLMSSISISALAVQ
jgi:hypothetical protein